MMPPIFLLTPRANDAPMARMNDREKHVGVDLDCGRKTCGKILPPATTTLYFYFGRIVSSGFVLQSPV
jgi:hypothetical protein